MRMQNININIIAYTRTLGTRAGTNGRQNENVQYSSEFCDSRTTHNYTIPSIRDNNSI